MYYKESLYSGSDGWSVCLLVEAFLLLGKVDLFNKGGVNLLLQLRFQLCVCVCVCVWWWGVREGGREGECVYRHITLSK